MDKLAFLYVVLLFVVYQIMFKITGFSVNTAVYGLFAVLIWGCGCFFGLPHPANNPKLFL